MNQVNGLRLAMLLLVSGCCLPVLAQPTPWELFVTLGKTAQSERRFADAEQSFRAAITEAALSGMNHPSVSTSYFLLARLYQSWGKADQTQGVIDEYVDACEKAFGANDPRMFDPLAAAGTFFFGLGQKEKAEALHLRGLEICTQAYGSDDPRMADPLLVVGRFYTSSGLPEKALPYIQHSLAIREKSDGAESITLIPVLTELDSIYWRQKQYADVEPIRRRLLSLQEAAYGPEDSRLYYPLNNLVFLYQRLGSPDRVLPMRRRMLAIWERTYGPGTPEAMVVLRDLAADYQRLGDSDTAEKTWRQLAADAEVRKESRPDLDLLARKSLAEFLLQQERFTEAEPLLTDLVATAEKSTGAGDIRLGEYLVKLAYCYARQGEMDKVAPLQPRIDLLLTRMAGQLIYWDDVRRYYLLSGKLSETERLARSWLGYHERSFGPDTFDVADRLDDLTEVLLAENKPADAQPFLQRALTIRENTAGTAHTSLIRTLLLFAQCMEAQGQPDAAANYYQRVAGIADKALAPDSPNRRPLVTRYAALLRKMGRDKEADQLLPKQ